MRTCYVPRDVPESATNASSELKGSNFKRSDSDITEGTMSHTTSEDNFSFTDDLSDSGPLTYIPSLTIVYEEDEMVEEYPDHDMPGEFPDSLGLKLARCYYGRHKTICCYSSFKTNVSFSGGCSYKIRRRDVRR
jgi:hypothetical protein